MAARNKEIPLLAVPCLVCCSVTSVLFVSGILGFLKYGALVVLISGLLAIPLWLITSFETRALSRLVGIYIFLVLFSYLLISKEHSFWIHDEFSHWGLAIRSVFEEQALWDESSLVFAKSYPPGQILFQYFMIARDNWSEAIVYRSQTLFVVSAALAVIGWMISSATGRIVGFAAILLTPLTLGLTYGVLLPDTAQAFLFASAISIAITGLNFSKLLMLMATTFNLTLLKDTGLLLGATVVVLVWLSSKSGYLFSSRPWKQNLVYISGAASALLLPFVAWQLYLRSIMSKSPVSTVLTESGSENLVAGVLSAVSPVSTVLTESGSENLVAGVLSAVYERISHPFFPTIFNLQSQKLGIPDVRISLLQLTIAILIVHTALVLLKEKSERRGAAQQVAVILVGLILFLLAHVVLYITMFSEFEALSAAGLERYLSVYLIAWLVIVIGLSISHIEVRAEFHYSTPLKLSAVSIGTLVAIGITCLLFIDPRVTPQPEARLEANQEINLAASALKKYISPTDRVFFIYEEPAYMKDCQYNCGLSAYYAFRFAMFPHKNLSPACTAYVIANPAIDSCLLGNEYFGDWDYVLTMNPTKELARISPLFNLQSFTGQMFEIFHVENSARLNSSNYLVPVQ